MDVLSVVEMRGAGNLEKDISKMIKKMNKQRKTINEISNMLVYDVQISPEFAWRMIRKTLGLRQII